MRSRADHAKGWLLKGDSDLNTARQTIAGDGPYDTACFHAQQAAEKFLKALIAYADAAIPRTHDLDELTRLAPRTRPNWT
jgi:HEPN domain-containing protein